MKMVKSLLLGSAAGLVAVAGAQAADLPVKAKPVEYVKVCSLYGEGFFYIPGTDTCIKFGGWVRTEAVFHGGGSHSPFISGGGGLASPGAYTDSVFRARTVLSTDVRTQTEYGVLRAYLRMGFDRTTGQIGTHTLYAERAFIQFAGFTFGMTQSYFDFFSGAFSYGQAYIGGGSATGAAATLVAAYTAQLGNGLTATLSVEDGTQRRNALWDAGQNALAIGAMPGPLGSSFAAGPGSCSANLVTADNGVGAVAGCATGDYAAHSVPDIVGALRVDQAWGSAQIAAAMHEVKGNYYGNNADGTAANYTGVQPDAKYGFAVMGGLVLNVPWNQGDKLWIEATYSKGASSYNGLSWDGLYSNFNRFSGSNVAAGWALDGIFANTTPGNSGNPLAPSGIQLTSAFSIGAAFEHYWTPALRTSVFGTYNSVDFNAVATNLFCGAGANSPVRTAAGATGTFAAPVAGCNPDFRIWGVGTRTIWNPVRNLDIGVEVMYSQIDQDMDANLTRLNYAGSSTGRKAGLYTPSDEGQWSAVVRVQRNFWP